MTNQLHQSTEAINVNEQTAGRLLKQVIL